MKQEPTINLQSSCSIPVEKMGPPPIGTHNDKSKSNVNHPSHYNAGKIEVITVIEDWGLNFCLGNTVKYIGRADHKGRKLEDLQKARWYLDREIAKVEEEYKCTSKY